MVVYIHRGVVDRRGREHWTEVRERRTLYKMWVAAAWARRRHRALIRPALGPPVPGHRLIASLSAAARFPPNEIPSCRAGLTMPRRGAGRAKEGNDGSSYAHE